jgi:hypothetical protein
MLTAPLERSALWRRGHPANAPSGFFFATAGAECQPSARAECDAAIVVESVVWRSKAN